MLASTESMSLLLILNVLFAALALGFGFAGGIWFGAGRQRRTTSPDSRSPESQKQELMQRERAAMATERLRDLASGVAVDVCEHSSRMGEITDSLKSLDVNNVEATGAGLVNALASIVTANDNLQKRLAKAEEQIAAQAREIHLHEAEARTDSLTKLANRRAFDDALRQRHAEATRTGGPMSLLLMDIDHFKRFNDTHGHLAGDEVLRAVGQQLVSTCREMDLPCRYGGEEFAVIMPATRIDAAKVAAERVRRAVEKIAVDFDDKQLTVTTSIGVAELTPGCTSALLIRRADDALYHSKDAGRNCAHWNDGNSSHPLDIEPSQTPTPPPQVVTTTLDKLPNRTKFADELRRRMAEADRTEQPVVVVVAELNNHTDLRRSYGNEVALAALEATAAVLTTSVREMDLVARLSDDQFALMLPGGTSNSAELILGRASAAFDACTMRVQDGDHRLSLLTGMAKYRTGDTVEDLVQRAQDDIVGAPAEQEAKNAVLAGSE